MQHLCPRCRLAITTEDDGALHFCPHCGAPQVWVSEELLGAATEATLTNPLSSPTLPPSAAMRDRIDWHGAINCAALAGLIAFMLELLALTSGVFDTLAVFWAIAAPIVTLGIYSARFRESTIRPGFGARLGLLCGVAISLGIASVDLVHTLLLRLVYHKTGELDAETAARFAQVKAQTLAQSGAAALPLISMLDVPEFRAAILLCGLAFVVTLYLAFTMTGGAFAGFLRARKSVGGRA